MSEQQPPLAQPQQPFGQPTPLAQPTVIEQVSLDQQIQSLVQQIGQLKTSIQGFNQQKQDILDQIPKVRQEINLQMTQLKETNKSNEQKVLALTQEKNKLQIEVERFKVEGQSFIKQKTNEARLAIEAAQAAQAQDARSAQEAQAKVQATQEELQVAQAQAQAQAQQAQQAQSTIDDLTKQIATLKSQMIASGQNLKKISELSQKVQRLEQEKSQISANVQTLTDSFAELKTFLPSQTDMLNINSEIAKIAVQAGGGGQGTEQLHKQIVRLIMAQPNSDDVSLDLFAPLAHSVDEATLAQYLNKVLGRIHEKSCPHAEKKRMYQPFWNMYQNMHRKCPYHVGKQYPYNPLQVPRSKFGDAFVYLFASFL